MILAAYLAGEGFETPLAEELERRGVRVQGWHGRLALSPDPPVPAAWALDVWTDPRDIPSPSVKAAADALRGMQRNWAAYAVAHHRRMALIAERLPPVASRPLVFPAQPPTSHLGAWTLLAPDRLLASPSKTSPFVNGECRFVEDRVGPPSRAYLKLWEACAHWRAWPAVGDRVIDLGAAPGGWTWALSRLGAVVTAVDKAPLDPAVTAMPNVTLRQESAFGLSPEPVEWLFSDVIAYPGRMLQLIQRWIDAEATNRVVCTIKFQGATDHAAAEAFAAMPGGRVAHLFHNKHELTFWWTRPADQAATDRLSHLPAVSG
jgi:23S rRNA (cytidine2498-2'-O)-methyltransferase